MIRLDPEEARQAGAVMGGASRRPALVHDLEIALGELVIEWIHVSAESSLVGRSIGESQVRARSGVTVIALIRDGGHALAAEPQDVVRAADVLVTVGRLGDYTRFRELFGSSATN